MVKKYYKILSFITLLILALSLSNFTKAESLSYKTFEPFKMVFIPDIKLAFEKESDKVLYKESFVIFQDVIRQINKDREIEFVVFGGDITGNDDGKLSDMPMFLDSAYDINAKYYAIFGDRDADLVKDLTKSEFAREFPEFDKDTDEKTFWAVEPVKNVLLIGLDTSIKNKEEGYLNLHQLFWLDKILQDNPDKFTIITMHHPALPSAEIDKTAWQKYMLKKPELFLEIVTKYPQVKLILSGSHYNNHAQVYKNKLFISNPSIVVYPNTFKVLEVYPDKLKVENKKISFKQIIKKAGKNLVNSEYAKEFNPAKPKKVTDFHKGDKFSNRNVYYFDKLEEAKNKSKKPFLKRLNPVRYIF